MYGPVLCCSEINQTENKYHVISLICGPQKKNNKQNKTKHIIQRREWWLPEREEGWGRAN